MMSFCFLCSLLLVGWSVAVSLDTGAIRNKRQGECDTVGIAQNCSQDIYDIDAESQYHNLTEYRIRLNKEAAIKCTEPCFTALQDHYQCVGAGDLDSACLQHNGTYCYPLFLTEVIGDTNLIGNISRHCNGSINDCGGEQCQNLVQTIADRLGCCDSAIFESGLVFPRNTSEICQLDLDDSCDSAGVTIAFFGLVVMVAIIVISLIQ